MGHKNENDNCDSRLSIEDLYPDLSPEETLEVEQRLDDFLRIALRMMLRLESDPEAYEVFHRLTDEEREIF